MQSETPVLTKTAFPFPELVIGKNQPQYQPVHALLSADENGLMTLRFRLTWRERWSLLISGNIWLQQLTFHNKFAPVKLLTVEPKVEECL